MIEDPRKPPIQLEYRSDPEGVEGRAKLAHRCALLAMSGGFAGAGLAMAGGLLERPALAVGMLCVMAGGLGGLAIFHAIRGLRLKSDDSTDRHLSAFGGGLGLLSVFAAVRFLWTLIG